MEIFDDRVCRLGEGPHYDERTDRVVWVDILGGRVLWRAVDGHERGELPVEGHPAAAVPRRGGGLVLCLRDGPVLLDPDGTLRLLDTYDQSGSARPAPRRDPDQSYGHGPGLRSNDAKADRRGRLWLGTMAYDEKPGAGTLYRLDPGATSPVPVVAGVTVSNGLGWSPDGSTMYYVDSPTRRLDAFAYDLGSGALTDRRTVAEFPDDWGFPDGMTVDAGGGLWIAFWDGGAVRRFDAGGELDRVVAVGTPRVTSCTFAGEAFDLLVITTAAGDTPGAGLTYVHRPGDVVGLPVDRYDG